MDLSWWWKFALQKHVGMKSRYEFIGLIVNRDRSKVIQNEFCNDHIEPNIPLHMDIAYQMVTRWRDHQLLWPPKRYRVFVHHYSHVLTVLCIGIWLTQWYQHIFWPPSETLWKWACAFGTLTERKLSGNAFQLECIAYVDWTNVTKMHSNENHTHIHYSHSLAHIFKTATQQ